MLNDKVIGIRQFMAMLDIKSETTFNKKAKADGFPEAIEWPPGSKSRGWYLSEAEAHVNNLMQSARRWSDVKAEQPDDTTPA